MIIIPYPLAQNKKDNIKVSTDGKEYQSESFMIAQLGLRGLINPLQEAKPFFQFVPIAYGIPAQYSIVSAPEGFKVSSHEGMSVVTTDSLFVRFIAASIFNTLLTIYTKSANDLPTQSEIRNLINKILSKHLSHLLPYVKSYSSITDIKVVDSYGIYTESSKYQIILEGITLKYKNSIGAESWLPFSSLSDGTQRVFYIISEITASFLSFLDEEYLFNNESKVITLEEPELGIHPHQLHLLLNFLREQSEKHQLIITTHSPQVLD
ncbi:MAG: ATP-binding protein, partial [Sphingobacteriaceae bacterium]